MNDSIEPSQSSNSSPPLSNKSSTLSPKNKSTEHSSAISEHEISLASETPFNVKSSVSAPRLSVMSTLLDDRIALSQSLALEIRLRNLIPQKTPQSEGINTSINQLDTNLKLDHIVSSISSPSQKMRTFANSQLISSILENWDIDSCFHFFSQESLSQDQISRLYTRDYKIDEDIFQLAEKSISVDDKDSQLEINPEEFTQEDESLVTHSILSYRNKRKLRSIKKRQRPATLPRPTYNISPITQRITVQLKSHKDYKPNHPSTSIWYDSPDIPSIFSQPASKKRRFLIQGYEPAIEYTFIDTSINEYGNLLGNTDSDYPQNGTEISLPKPSEVSRKWFIICKREIPRNSLIQAKNFATRRANAKTIAIAAMNYVNLNLSRIRESIQHRASRNRVLCVSLTSVVQRNEKEWRRIADREIELSRKADEDERDRERAQKKLNFLITQTELYSHFMAKKLGINEIEATIQAQNGTKSQNPPPESAFYDEESAQQDEAKREALRAYKQHLGTLEKFDKESSKLRVVGTDGTITASPTATIMNSTPTPVTTQTSHSYQPKKTGSIVSTNMPIALSTGAEVGGMIEQPRGLLGNLKPYQVKGLNWLNSLYEQGINGILADEMGLGKTVQAISLLAHLAENRGIWGPFIIIAPTSTLPNWAAEIQKFYPDFKVLPYWGTQKQRGALRKLLNPKYLHRKDSVAHVVVTSYSLIVLDEKFFHRIHWEYMILDEAHAIKSSTSVRWNTLLGFGHCRNRLLLTGTPIQNNMAELWALLHFIMPSLFDSHNEFYEWFSKDIEEHAQGSSGLNEHQLKRLHMILKPFMLRRVKADIAHEMPPKTEVEIRCDMTPRQISLYAGIKNKVSIGQLFNRINVPQSRAAQEKQSKHLMNIVMQFRNVCNHPEILQRSEATAPIQFSPAFPPIQSYSNTISPSISSHIQIPLPQLIYKKAWRKFMGHSNISPELEGLISKWIFNRFNIFSQYNTQTSLFPRNTGFDSGEIKSLKSSEFISQKEKRQTSTKRKQSKTLILEKDDPQRSHTWDCTRLFGLSPSEIEWFKSQDGWIQWLWVLGFIEKNEKIGHEYFDHSNPDLMDDDSKYLNPPKDIFPLRKTTNILRIHSVQYPTAPHNIGSSSVLSRLISHIPEKNMTMNMNLIKTIKNASTSIIWAPTPELRCSSSQYTCQQIISQYFNGVSTLLLGTSRSEIQLTHFSSPPSTVQVEYPKYGIACTAITAFGPSSIRVPQFTELVRDSGKLKVLDSLLTRLKREGHKVLVYSQFTEVLDLLEDFLYVRGFKFVRLDGSSKLDDRRDVVDLFQSDTSLFVFLLSTRAGGVGINLTAADTVIFYDSDWNPTMDAQAMDRAHRLGQTRPVTVYRLITRNSVEERILLRAKQKGTIQSLVIQGGNFNISSESEDVFKPSEMMDLILDDSELEAAKAAEAQQHKKKAFVNPIMMGMKPRSSKPVKPAKQNAGLQNPTFENSMDEEIVETFNSRDQSKSSKPPSAESSPTKQFANPPPIPMEAD